MKKIISVLLIAAMFLSLPVAASASDLTTADALAILRAVAGITTLTAEQQTKYGITDNVSSADALRVLRTVAGISGNTYNEIGTLGRDDNFVPIERPAAISETPLTAASKSGDIVRFGKSTREEETTWIVLEVRDGKALLLSYYAPASTNNGVMATTWAESDFRTMQAFQSDFYINRLDMVHLINETSVSTPNNAWFKTNGGATVTDKLFLLSVEEVVKYFGDSGQLGNQPANQTGRFARITDEFNENRIATQQQTATRGAPWWLRTPGDSGSSFAYVTDKGEIIMSGDTGSANFRVRPAMWVTIE
ncbi:MAG: DUF6273 domain-containing protein [Oscillospiraceae bacterium]|nr:DUF6273 domain-containing protein [Oscillospiraceae bacterium]